MRLIDADAFKEYMWKALEETRGCYPDKGEWAEAITEQFCKDIDDQPTVQPEPHWTKCSERLPEDEKRVLILNDDGLCMVGFIRDRDIWGKEWRYQYEMYDDDVYEENEQGKIVAWMPLPERYNGGDEDGKKYNG